MPDSTLPSNIPTSIPAASEAHIGAPARVNTTVTRIGIPPIMLSMVKPSIPSFFFGVSMKSLLAMNPMAIITKKRGDWTLSHSFTGIPERATAISVDDVMGFIQ